MAEINLGNKILDNHIIRFICSAGLGALVDVLAFYIFYHNLFQQKVYDMHFVTVRNSTLSLAISFFLGVIVNFLVTRYFVFTESKSSAYKQFFRFILVAIVGFFANLTILKIFIQYFQIYPPVARILAILSLFFASYFIHRTFSFSLSLKRNASGTDHK